MGMWTEKDYQEFCKKHGRPPGSQDALLPAPRKGSKYRNRKTEFNGKTYDSQREANRAAELQLLQRAGEGGIATVLEQVSFTLPGGVKYRADFLILRRDGTFIIEDAKGVRTKEYVIKKKLMAELGLEIREV